MKGTSRKIALLTAIVFILTAAFGGITNVYASGNIWYDKYVALESSIGGNYYTSPLSSSLAWGESYVMESYLDLYKATGNTAWLNKIVTHTDTMLSNTNDYDGDGYLGWDTARYSPAEVDNSGFETGAAGDSTLPDQWTRFQSTSSTAYRCVSPVMNGTYAFAILTNGTTWQKLYQRLNNYVPNTRYNLNLYAKTNGSAAKGRAYIHDRTTNTILASVEIDTTTWTYFSVDFTTPSVAGHQIEVWLGHMSYSVTGGVAYFDDVKVTGYFPFLVHDGMITLPIAKFIKLINTTPALQSAYLAKANTYRSFIEDEIVPKWENSSYYGNCWVNVSSTEGYYKLPPNKDTYVNTNPGDIVPYNMMLVYANMLMNMYDVNGNATYLDRAKKVNTFWKNDLLANGTAYKWKYWLLSANMEDTSHGMLDVGSALDMFRHNSLVFNGTDMEKFVDTLMDYMWNGSKTSPTVTYRVDGTGDTTTFTRSLANWVELTQFHIDTWWIAANQLRNITPTSAVDLQVLGQVMVWDPQKIVNQGFELKTSFDSTQPARWNRSTGATSSTVYLDSANKFSGNYGLAIKANGTAAQQLWLTTQDWSASTQYQFSFDGCTDGTAAGGRIIVKDDTSGIVLAQYDFTNTTWQNMSFTFTMPSITTHNVRVYLTNKDYTVTNGKAYFDNVKMKKVGDSW